MSESAEHGPQPHGHRRGGEHSNARPSGGRPGYGKPNDGRPATGRPAGSRSGSASGSGAGSSAGARSSSGTGRPGSGKPNSGKGGPGKAGAGQAGSGKGGAGKPARTGDRGARRDDTRLWTKGGAPARGDRTARERELPEDRDPFGTRSVRSRHDDPVIPDTVSASELDRIARNELKTLAKENAEEVARHLVMAARLIGDSPELAHQHAISAARRAGRIGVVRETLAITAYATGDYALALRELRTYRRITGRDDQLPMMVDSERGMGRPERALELGRSVPRSSLPVPVQVELAIAMSGARLDLGDAEAALTELRIPQLDPSTAFSYSPGLFDAFAAVLEELGRNEEAEEWYARADVAVAALQEANGEAGDLAEIVVDDLEEGDDEEADYREEASEEAGDGENDDEAPGDESDAADPAPGDER